MFIYQDIPINTIILGTILRAPDTYGKFLRGASLQLHYKYQTATSTPNFIRLDFLAYCYNLPHAYSWNGRVILYVYLESS